MSFDEKEPTSPKMEMVKKDFNLPRVLKEMLHRFFHHSN